MTFSTKSVLFRPWSPVRYVTMGDVLYYNLSTSPLSGSVWAKWTVSSGMTFLSKRAEGTFDTGYQFYTDSSGHVALVIVASSLYGKYLSVRTNGTFNDGVWHHLAFSYDGSQTASGIVLYVDGSPVATTIVWNSGLMYWSPYSAQFALGCWGPSLGEPFTGRMDEVALYNKVLSAAEVTWIYHSGAPRDLLGVGSPSNLVGWWRMGEGDTFPTLLDSSTGGHNGTMVNMVSGDIVEDAPAPAQPVLDETVTISEAVTAEIGVPLTETVTISESCEVDLNRVVSITESVPIEERLGAVFDDEIYLEVIGASSTGETFRATLPRELALALRSPDAATSSLQFTSLDGGVPLQILSALKDYTIYFEGSSAYLRYQNIDPEIPQENRFAHSEDFSASVWGTTGGTINHEAVPAPRAFAFEAADEFVEAVNPLMDPGPHYAGVQNFPFSGVRITFSVYAKKSGRDWLRLKINGASTYFDLTSGEPGSTQFGWSLYPAWGMEDAGGGWYRCWISVNIPVSDVISYYFYVGPALGDLEGDYNGFTGLSALYLFGPQLSQTSATIPYLRSGETFVPYAELVLPKILEESDYTAFPGNYAEITNGVNAGIYKIRGILAEDTEDPQPVVLQLDAVLPFTDPLNGYVGGFLEFVSSSYESGIVNRFHFPSVPDLLTIEEFVFWETRSGSDHVAGIFYVDPGEPEYVKNYYYPNGGWDPSISTVYAVARTTPGLEWRVTSGITKFLLETSKPTGDKTYRLWANDLVDKNDHTFSATGYLTVGMDDVQRPRMIGVTLLANEGIVLVEYDQPMQADDETLFNPDDYSITGPTTVTIKQVFAYSPTTVALRTAGLGAGSYTLTVSTSTPKDLAGNPIDPTWNATAFTSAVPLTIRSLYTDKGPIAKPPLTLQSGINATLDTFTQVKLPGATLTSNHVGKYVTLGGSAINDGSFRVTSVLAPTLARVQASFTLPDPASGSLTWELYDPQDGLIADDPADVTVRVNGSPVTPDAVVGLLGQVVLPSAPLATDDVRIDYSWCCNPTVDLRRLNSREFRLNAWNRDRGYPYDLSQHKYRFNNVLVRPSDYEPDDPRAVLDQPELRELHYRAYERAYTPVLNDPTLLLLNSPIHRIAYPPAQRTLSEESVAYEATGLPENQVVNPWTRRGSGIATASGGTLTVIDNTSGPYPTGQPFFWTRTVDLTFSHVFAMSWRFLIDSVAAFDGVFSGVAIGYSDEEVAAIVGYLEVSGTKKVGILKRGYADDPSSASAWTTADFDWSVLHSYRIYRDPSGVVRLYTDGGIDSLLQVTADELPFLEELDVPMDSIEDVFFGSLSRPAMSTSTWDFVRYLVQPINPIQTSPSSFVSYEANIVPEQDVKPWTPVGYHGTETILATDFLLLDATSASDVTDIGYMGGDYRGFLRFEPLLTQASEFVIDANVQLRTYTHGVSHEGLIFAVDDGTRLMQICFFPDRATPKISYGGRSLPGDFSPYSWSSLGSQTAAMVGRVLRITDSSTIDGLVYYYDDLEPAASDDRIIAATTDYFLEFRCKVVSYTVDGSGFAGAFGHVFDGTRSVGLLLRETGGVRYATFHSDGVMLTQFIFDWNDSEPHTYRLSKSTAGNLVSLFVDGTFLGSLAYNSFTAPGPSTTGQVSFGSSTPASSAARSVVEWSYCNAWRARSDLKHYVGLWKGSDSATLLGYHLPLKASGRGATAVANALGDGNADFLAAGVVSGDKLVVDVGPNRAVYEIATVAAQNLTLTSTWPQQPSLVDYRIVKEVDWTTYHKYRLTRDSTGEVALLLDADTEPLIRLSYGPSDLPNSGGGFVRTLSGGLPATAFGSFSVENIAQSSWDYVRYGITKAPSELRMVPHHEVINQWNVMGSPERLYTLLPHDLTSFKSSSTGIVPKEDPDFMADSGLTAFTLLNEGTPLVPKTQTFEVRAPYPTQEFISALNRPEDVLNSDADFTLNDGAIRYRLVVPDNVLYSSLDVIEQTNGELSLLSPFCDGCSPTITGLNYTKEVCLDYDGAVLPEQDTAAPTPWSLLSDDPGQVSASAFAGILTYGTGSGGTKSVYLNNTPLPDAPGLRTEARFRFKVLADSTLGTADSQIRVGLSAPGLTVGLAFVTTAMAERIVYVVDVNNGRVLGSATFDFLDGNYHTYRIVRDPGRGVVQISIDS